MRSRSSGIVTFLVQSSVLLCKDLHISFAVQSLLMPGNLRQGSTGALLSIAQ